MIDTMVAGMYTAKPPILYATANGQNIHMIAIGVRITSPSYPYFNVAFVTTTSTFVYDPHKDFMMLKNEVKNLFISFITPMRAFINCFLKKLPSVRKIAARESKRGFATALVNLIAFVITNLSLPSPNFSKDKGP